MANSEIFEYEAKTRVFEKKRLEPIQKLTVTSKMRAAPLKEAGSEDLCGQDGRRVVKEDLEFDGRLVKETVTEVVQSPRLDTTKHDFTREGKKYFKTPETLRHR